MRNSNSVKCLGLNLAEIERYFLATRLEVVWHPTIFTCSFKHAVRALYKIRPKRLQELSGFWVTEIKARRIVYTLEDVRIKFLSSI